jgi:predicted DNA-binding transcriptional regulator AlpA
MVLRDESYPKEKPYNPEKRIWVTPREAIRISGIKRTRLYELMNDGTIKSIKLGGKRLVSYASIETLGQ